MHPELALFEAYAAEQEAEQAEQINLEKVHAAVMAQLAVTDKWLEHKVKSKLVDEIVILSPDSINIQAYADLVDSEISFLITEDLEMYDYFEAQRLAAMKHPKPWSDSPQDYWQDDVENLEMQRDIQACHLKTLTDLRSDKDGLYSKTEKIIRSVRKQAYGEAVAILHSKAVQQNALQQANTELEDQLAKRDIALWDGEVTEQSADVVLES